MNEFQFIEEMRNSFFIHLAEEKQSVQEEDSFDL